MTFDIQQYFPRPASVSSAFYNSYVVISAMTALVICAEILSAGLLLFFGYASLIVFPGLTVLAWLIISALNKRGRQRRAVLLMTSSSCLLAIAQILVFGWDAGFQFYLVAVIATLLLYPHPNKNLSILVAATILFGFLLAYYVTVSHTNSHPLGLTTGLYALNAVLCIVLIGGVNFYFRTNISLLIKRLNNSANTDLLTNLINRRGMNAELKRYSSLQERVQHQNSLILIDIDNFKYINDTYGHSAGDEVLRQFTTIVRQRLRESDLISRWGGEEFLILAPFTGPENASALAETLRQAVQESVFEYEGQQITLTLTAGIAELSAIRPIAEALKRVDKLLYHGKSAGRNQVVV